MVAREAGLGILMCQPPRQQGFLIGEINHHIMHTLCFYARQTIMQAMAHTEAGYTSKEQEQGRNSTRGSTRIRQLLHRKRQCRRRARRPALCGRIYRARADRRCPGADGETGCRRQCLYRSDKCVLHLSLRANPQFQYWLHHYAF
jgi:hypothetical protein